MSCKTITNIIMKNIKYLLSLLLIISLVTAAGTNTYAQQVKSKGKKEQKKVAPKEKIEKHEMHPKDTLRMNPDKPKGEKGDAELIDRPQSERGSGERPEPGKDRPEHNMGKDSTRHETGKRPDAEIEKDNEGHAYGRNKGDLEGKEFGQARAEQAKMEQHKKEFELGNSVMEGEAKVKESREKINAAREKLEADRKAKKISESQYKEKKEKIDKAEKAVNDLEMEIQRGKEIKQK